MRGPGFVRNLTSGKNRELLFMLVVWSGCIQNTHALLLGMIHSDAIPLSPRIMLFNTSISVSLAGGLHHHASLIRPPRLLSRARLLSKCVFQPIS